MSARVPTIVGVVVLLFLLNISHPVFASNLLTNSDFENGTEKWANSSSAVVSISETVKHGGMRSLILTKETKSWAYISQKVPVEANIYYKLSGWGLANDEHINNIKLRFYWLDGGDKKSDVIDKETKLKSTDFQFIETDGVISPEWAQFADIQAYIYLDEANPTTPAVFDDLIFETYIPPTPTLTPTPTAIPSATPNPTATPTNTSVPTKTPTPSISPTIKPTLTSSPTATPTVELSSTIIPSPTGVVLGAQDTQVSTNKKYIIALLFISAGCALLAGVFVIKNRLYLKK